MPGGDASPFFVIGGTNGERSPFHRKSKHTVAFGFRMHGCGFGMATQVLDGRGLQHVNFVLSQVRGVDLRRGYIR
jgi:hypothetical protein